MIHEEISGEIIGAAMTVLNTLKPGLDEKLYENALLVIELAKRGLAAEQQRDFPVHYDGHYIGKLIPDLIVDDRVIVEAKVVDAFNQAHRSQLLGYLAISELKLGLLINFKHASLKWERIVRERFHDCETHPRNPRNPRFKS